MHVKCLRNTFYIETITTIFNILSSYSKLAFFFSIMLILWWFLPYKSCKKDVISLGPIQTRINFLASSCVHNYVCILWLLPNAETIIEELGSQNIKPTTNKTLNLLWQTYSKSSRLCQLLENCFFFKCRKWDEHGEFYGMQRISIFK